ncbi:threonine/serine exporter family protein [Bacillus massiliglaciei]|uniref:threonine/serine exporter family protein n=1 Tax=Bacillus massiliglaciei TaxID=1816693 RepID=UPI000AF26B63|nr:threonine/serine exporter family protein [Bacillus massiliglaciei]
MELAEQLITSFIASAAFGVIFNAPKNSLVQCGLVGMAGWGLYFWIAEQGMNSIVATLAAAFVVSVISQSFAKRYKTPVIIFNVAGIIPLVPGGLSYDAMKHFVENDYYKAVELAAKVFMLAGSIALGLMLAEVLRQVIAKVHKRNERAGGKQP